MDLFLNFIGRLSGSGDGACGNSRRAERAWNGAKIDWLGGARWKLAIAQTPKEVTLQIRIEGPVGSKDFSELLEVEGGQGSLFLGRRQFLLPGAFVELGECRGGTTDVECLWGFVFEDREEIALDWPVARDGEAGSLRSELAGQQRIHRVDADAGEVASRALAAEGLFIIRGRSCPGSLRAQQDEITDSGVPNFDVREHSAEGAQDEGHDAVVHVIKVEPLGHDPALLQPA